MNRIIFGISLLLSTVILVIAIGGNWVDSATIPDEVSAGYAVWQSYGCENCHTLFGQGGNYAPDLTRIYNLRGEDYIRRFIANPSAYYPNQRLMPRFTITQIDVGNLIAMLNWTANDTSLAENWPPNPIQILDLIGIQSSEYEPLDEGRLIFSRLCASCHSLEPNIIIVGPSLWAVVDRTIEQFPDTAPEEYIRNSILYPSDYIVDGFQDIMQKNFAEVLTSDEISSLVNFIMSLRDIES